MTSKATLYQLNYYKPAVDRAMQQTEAYMAKYKLLLTGGKAVDLALRLQDQRIYEDDSVSHFHFISDEYVHHVKKLVKILCRDGLPDISIRIKGGNANTLRIRMKQTVLLDASFVPATVLKLIPGLPVGDLRIVHPHFMFIEQRLFFSQLLTYFNDSRSVFRHLIKDIHRNLQLRKLHPVTTILSLPVMTSVSIPLDLIRIDQTKLDQVNEHCFVYTGKACLAGAVGAAIMLGSVEITQSALVVDIPVGLQVRILSCDMSNLQPSFVHPKTYRPLLHMKPACVVDNTATEYVDTLGMRIGCYMMDLRSAETTVSVCVASVDYLLMELLRDRMFVSREPSTALYTRLVSAVDKKRNEGDAEPMWWPSLNSYGESFMSRKSQTAMEMIMNPVAALQSKSGYVNSECDISVDDKVVPIILDGAEDNTLEHTNNGYIRDNFCEYLRKMREV